MRKVTIVVVILILIGLAVGAYLYFSKEGPSAPNDGNDPAIPVEVAGNGESSVPRISRAYKEAVSGFWLNDSGEVFVVDQTGRIVGLSDTGEAEVLSSIRMPDVFSVSASNSGDKVLIGFLDEGVKSFRIFNVLAKTWRTLPDMTLGAAWSPDERELAYLGSSGDGVDINILNIDTGDAKRILGLNIAEADIIWAEADSVYLIEPPSQAVESRVFKIDLSSKIITTLKSGYGLTLTAVDEHFLMSFLGRDLFATDQDGLEVSSFNGSATVPEKCTAKDGSLFCGVSKNLTGSDFPEKYLQRAVYSNDYLEMGRIADSGSLQFVAVINDIKVPLDVWQPRLGNNRAFFINRYDQALYSVKLTAHE